MKKLILTILLLNIALSAQAGVAGKIRDLKYFVGTGMLAKAMAKEICSCVFNSGISPEECLERNHVPSAASGFQEIFVNQHERTVSVAPNNSIQLQGVGVSKLLLDAQSARAKYHDDGFQRGCTLE